MAIYKLDYDTVQESGLQITTCRHNRHGYKLTRSSLLVSQLLPDASVDRGSLSCKFESQVK